MTEPLLCDVCGEPHRVERTPCGAQLCEGCHREHLKECAACMSDAQAAKYANDV